MVQASVDGENWEEIDSKEDDTSLDKTDEHMAWEIQCDKYYPHFRLSQTGVNSRSTHVSLIASIPAE